MIQYHRSHCKFICRAVLDVIEATFRIQQLSQQSWQCLKTFNDKESQMLKSYQNSISIQSHSKCIFVDQLSHIVSYSYPSGSAQSSQMSTTKKNLGLYIVDCVIQVISISQPMERCSQTLNSTVWLVATNCKKVGPKCLADDNTKYWHKCPKMKIL